MTQQLNCKWVNIYDSFGESTKLQGMKGFVLIVRVLEIKYLCNLYVILFSVGCVLQLDLNSACNFQFLFIFNVTWYDARKITSLNFQAQLFQEI